MISTHSISAFQHFYRTLMGNQPMSCTLEQLKLSIVPLKVFFVIVQNFKKLRVQNNGSEPTVCRSKYFKRWFSTNASLVSLLRFTECKSPFPSRMHSLLPMYHPLLPASLHNTMRCWNALFVIASFSNSFCSVGTRLPQSIKICTIFVSDMRKGGRDSLVRKECLVVIVLYSLIKLHFSRCNTQQQ